VTLFNPSTVKSRAGPDTLLIPFVWPLAVPSAWLLVVDPILFGVFVLDTSTIIFNAAESVVYVKTV